MKPTHCDGDELNPSTLEESNSSAFGAGTWFFGYPFCKLHLPVLTLFPFGEQSGARSAFVSVGRRWLMWTALGCFPVLMGSYLITACISC